MQGKRRLLENTGLEAEKSVLEAEKELALQKEQEALVCETKKSADELLKSTFIFRRFILRFRKTCRIGCQFYETF